MTSTNFITICYKTGWRARTNLYLASNVPGKNTDKQIGMRINPSIQVQPTPKPLKQNEAESLSYQARVLKRALESQRNSESQLLKLIEAKGQVIDIRA